MIEATTQHGWQARKCIAPAAFALAAAVALPILAVLAFLARPVLLVLLGLLLAAAFVRATFHEHVRARWVRRRVASHVYRGVHMVGGVALDPGHCWARVEPNDQVVVGADDFVQTVLGPIDQVELPAVGARVDRGQKLFSLRRGGRRIELPAPVSGTILGVNDALRAQPELINAHPFQRGWIVVIRGEHLPEERRHLLIGRGARRWFHQEVDFLFRLLPAGDGDDLYRRIDDLAWSVLHRSLCARRVA